MISQVEVAYYRAITCIEANEFVNFSGFVVILVVENGELVEEQRARVAARLRRSSLKGWSHHRG